jgi:ribosomal-protein-alanine N-acetyltransferase
MIGIVPAGLKHINGILRIERASFDPPWSENTLKGEFGRGDTFFSVAEDNGAVLGFVLLRLMSGEAELFQLAVTDAYRRSGIGGRLLAAALGFARSGGAQSVYLEVRPSNEAAVRLYENYGFSRQGRRKNYYANPVEDAALMSVDLHPNTIVEGDI